MGLFAQIPAVEAQRALVLAQGISVALGDAYPQVLMIATGDGAAAASAAVAAYHRKAHSAK